jgi:hypothetical protein
VTAPDLWWSPTRGAIQKFEDHFLVYGGGTGVWWGTFVPADFPPDAVSLAPVPAVMTGERAGAIKGGTVFEWVKQMVAEYTAEVGSPPPPEIVAHITVAVLREMGWEKQVPAPPAELKPALLALRSEILQDPGLSQREVEDLKGAVLLLIMHLNQPR